MRADARHNRERILEAAREVFVRQGADAPLDAVAARAGVGIATLYRRFPDRGSLARAVVVDALESVAEVARLALAEEPDPFRALARYLHGALDLRVSAAIPALLDQVALDDPEIRSLRQGSSELFQRLIDRAQEADALRPDVAFGDVALLLVRLARPLPGSIPHALEDRLAHRHLDIFLDGLRTARDHRPIPLPGPALALEDLRSL